MPMPAIQFLSPVGGHLRGKFFPGTGFYVEFVAWFLVLWALVNPWARCPVMALWKPQKCSFRGPGLLGKYCLSTVAALEQVRNISSAFMGATWNVCPTYKQR